MSNMAYNDNSVKSIATAIRAIDMTEPPKDAQDNPIQGVPVSDVKNTDDPDYGGMTIGEMQTRIANLVVPCTEQQYEDLETKNPHTLYIILDDASS